MRYSSEKTQPYIFHQYGQILKVGSLILLMMMCFRFFFIFKFTDLVLLKKNLPTTFEGLFLGLRFDLSIVAIVASLPFLVSTIGLIFNRERFLYFIPYFNRFWLFIFSIVIMAVLICDVNFYAFHQQHLNNDFFQVCSGPLNDIIHRLSRHYSLAIWIPVLMLVMVGIWFLLKRIFRRERIDLFYAQPIGKEGIFALIFSILVLLSFLSRGNFSEKSLSLEDAAFSSIDHVNELSVNGVMAFNRALQTQFY